MLLVLCPLKAELKNLIMSFKEMGLDIQHEDQVYKIPMLKMICAFGGHGKVSYALSAQRLISQHNISKAICLGAAGGLSPDLKIGDIVVGEKTVEHDLPERPIFEADAEMIRKFLDLNTKVHLGIIASGDEDILTSERATELFEQTGALAVAWEGAGGAKACLITNTPFLEIRIITDNCRDSVADSFTQNLPSCMKIVAKLLVKTI